MSVCNKQPDCWAWTQSPCLKSPLCAPPISDQNTDFTASEPATHSVSNSSVSSVLPLSAMWTRGHCGLLLWVLVSGPVPPHSLKWPCILWAANRKMFYLHLFLVDHHFQLCSVDSLFCPWKCRTAVCSLSVFKA